MRPAVGLPAVADQPFWAARLVALGVAPAAVPVAHLDVDRLAGALRAAVDDGSHRIRARELAAAVRDEDGAGRVAAALDRVAGA
jgi:sterol 3beta-glucosyltransferase